MGFDKKNLWCQIYALAQCFYFSFLIEIEDWVTTSVTDRRRAFQTNVYMLNCPWIRMDWKTGIGNLCIFKW